MRRHAKALIAASALLLTLVIGVTLAGAAAPVVSIDPAPTASYTTAQVSGTVDPEDTETYWSFEYSIDPGTEGWSGFTFQGPIGAGEGLKSVSQELTGLKPGTEYKVRLIANNLTDPEVISAEESFETEPVTPPAATIEPVTTFDATTASFEGSVDPEAPPGDPAAFDVNWHFQCDPGCGGSLSGQVLASEGLKTVTGQAKGLQPNTDYEVKLVASNAAGPVESSVEIFKTATAAPVPITVPNVPGDVGEVLLRGYVNPRNSEVTSCSFEYGPTSSYGQSAPCEGVPGAGGEPVLVSAQLSGLTPGATFHYSLEASSAAGSAATDDAIFASPDNATSSPSGPFPGQGFLPDSRAWEMVSPLTKNGGDIVSDSRRTRAAADGSAVGFISLANFGDVKGTGIATDYIAQRSTDPDPGSSGWSTHAVTAKDEGNSFSAIFLGLEPHYKGEFSPDLEHGVYLTRTALTGDPYTEDAINLYRRTDLRTPGPGAFELLTACPLCEETEVALPPFTNTSDVEDRRPELVGSTPDLERVFFESGQILTNDSPPDTLKRLYEWHEGEVRLAGRIPVKPEIACDDEGPNPCVAADTTQGGLGARFILSPHTVSDGSDGHSRIFFTRPTEDGVNPTPDSQFGDLYMRLDGHETVQLNVSEATPPEEFSQARFVDASADGTKVFFTSLGKLTDDSLAGTNAVYMYDATKPPSAPDNLTMISRDEEVDGFPSDTRTFVGSGGQGDYVYFIALGQLEAGGPFVGHSPALYLWHEGELRFIAQAPFGGEDEGGDPLDEMQASGGHQGNIPRQARVTPDGRHLLFSAVKGDGVGMLGYDHGAADHRQLYLYSADTDSLRCVSCNPSGAPATTAATTVARNGQGGSLKNSTHETKAVSDDGRYVFFTTAERLITADRNGVEDAYVFDTRTGEHHLLSSGEDAFPSFFLDASADGSNAFFTTRERLSGWDVDGAIDLYDARVGGGFPEPLPPPPSCQGDACQPQPPALNDPTPSSSTASGPGNQASNRSKASCPRGKRKVKARNGKSRCVQRKASKGANKREANSNRRAGR